MPEEIKNLDSKDNKEIDQANKKNILTFWFEIIKWLLGSLVLGTVGLLINKKIQETELDIKRMEADSKLLDVVTKNIVSNDSIEYRYLSFVKTFITTESIKRAVEIRRFELRKLMDEQALNKSQLDILKAEKKIINELSPIQRNEFKRVDSTVKIKPFSPKSLDINVLKDEENKIAGNVSSIDSGIIENLNAAKKIITPAVIEAKEDIYVLINNSQTKWCKDGYYVEFNNSLRIGINNLDPSDQTILVNFKDVENGKESPIPVPGTNEKTKTINVGETYSLINNNYRYQITLNYIGAAGKNPFTKAAYITVATYKKQ